MRIIKPSVQILEEPKDLQEALNKIEYCARTCYQSVSCGEPEEFIRGLMIRGHLSVLEHVSLSARFVVSRGITHELVRHRLASYSQESTRYVNQNNMDTILPWWMSETMLGEHTFASCADPEFHKIADPEERMWINAMLNAERSYRDMRAALLSRDVARGVLPNDLATTIVMTANVREWRHVLELRTSKHAHPDMRLIMNKLLVNMKLLLPVLFEDIRGYDANSSV